MKTKFGTMRFGKPYKTYFRTKSKKRFTHLGILGFIIISVTYCITSSLTKAYPLIEDIAHKTLEAKGAEIINTAVLNSIGDDIYSKVMKISRTPQGQITSITANTAEINKLKASITGNILNNIDQFESKGFEVPLGNLTDIFLLSGVGPKIPFRIVPYGSVNVDFRSQFTSAGINQTYHEIFIDVTADLHAMSAVAKAEAEVSTSVMAAQSVIVGDVPRFFAGE